MHHVLRNIRLALLMSLACAASATAQLLRPIDGFAQERLAHEGLARDSVCGREVSSDELTTLPGNAPKKMFMSLEALYVTDGKRRSVSSFDYDWHSFAGAHARLQPVLAASKGNCGAELTLNGWLFSEGRAAGAVDFTYVFDGARYGALRLIGIGQVSNAATFSGPLHMPSLAGGGGEYTTPNVFSILRIRERFDLRARLTAREDYARDSTGGASLSWRARPMFAGTTAVFAREFNVGVDYSAEVHPSIGQARQYLQQNTSLAFGPFGDNGIFGIVRYTWGRVGGFAQHEIGVHFGVYAF